jgi:glucokinase
MMTRSTVGLDIGGTKTLAALVAPDGSVIDSLTAPTPGSAGPYAVLGVAIELTRRVLAHRVPAAIGVGAAGVIDSGTGVVRSSTGSLIGWGGTDIRGSLLSAFPGVPVTVLNDVQAFALGESAHGVGRGVDDLLGVTVGTGIGGALLLAGRLVIGAHSAAGHIGHVVVPGAVGSACPCGRTGHLEAIASGPAMTRAGRRAGLVVDDLQAIAILAAAGDSVAVRVLDGGARALGLALGSLANVLDPELVVIGGGVAGLGDAWLELVRRAAHETTIPVIGAVRIERGSLGDDAVAVGAAVSAMIENPPGRNDDQIWSAGRQ